VFFVTLGWLVDADRDDSPDIYERSGGTVKLVAVDTAGANGQGWVRFVGASSDGTTVYFQTYDRLVASDTDDQRDAYARSGGTTTRISVGAVNGNGNIPARFRGASSDGTIVWFSSAEPLVADDSDTSIDVYQRSGGTTSLVSRGP
jgi:hypothetical protein